MAVERISTEVGALQQAAATVVAFGGKVEWPSLAASLDEFNTDLVAEPKHWDPAELELRDALGLGGGGG